MSRITRGLQLAFAVLALCSASAHAELQTWRMTAQTFDPVAPTFSFDITLDPDLAVDATGDPDSFRNFQVPISLTYNGMTQSLNLGWATNNFFGDVTIWADASVPGSVNTFNILMFGGGFPLDIPGMLAAIQTRTEQGIPTDENGLLVFMTYDNVGFGGNGVGFERIGATAVPEPASLALMLAALGGLGVAARRRA